MKTFKKSLWLTAGILTTVFAASKVYADTAANTVITNTVTVNYEDTNSNAQMPVQASVDITVNLVASAPTLSSPADVDPTTENTVVPLVYTITATANGPDTYNFSSVDTPANMDANAGFSTPSVTLGATSLAADAVATDTEVIVPYDNVDDDIVNGIAAGDTIVIGGQVYTVGAIDEGTSLSNNTVEIPLTSPITGATVTIGEIVGQQDTVTVNVTTDDITAGTSGTHTVSTTATSVANGAISTTQATATVITVRRPVLTINKYVRNITDPALTGASPITIDTVTWYASGVSGKPGDVMEYLIVVDNTAAGATDATNVVVSDPIPQFTSFEAGTILLDDDGTAANLAAFVGQDEGVDDGTDAAELDTTGNGTVYVYAGTGGVDTPAGATVGTGGTIAAGDISRVVFRVSID